VCNLVPKIEWLEEKKKFYHNLLAGHFHKDLITVILEESGYEVYPYGYESFLTPLKIKFEKSEIKQTEISKKIRSTPDLLVYDSENKAVELLEAKSRRWDRTDDVLIKALPRYRKYWQYSILVMVLPAGHFFYAQKVNRLKPRKDNVFDLNKEFKWFEDVFPKVDCDTLYSYKRQIIDFWNRPRKHFDPLETTLDRFNLYHLIQDEFNRSMQCSIDRLFKEQNERNLISRQAFNKAIETLVENGKIIKEGTKIRLS
jgi:hypothetical protein